MNDAGREKLIEAAMKGTKQVRGYFRDGDGRCALGVLMGDTEFSDLSQTISNAELARIAHYYEIETTDYKPCELCPETNERLGWTYAEDERIAHYNDFHGLDFLSIARKI